MSVTNSRLDAIAIVELLFRDRRADAERLIRTTDDQLDLIAALAWLNYGVLLAAGDQDMVLGLLAGMRRAALVLGEES